MNLCCATSVCASRSVISTIWEVGAGQMSKKLNNLIRKSIVSLGHSFRFGRSRCLALVPMLTLIGAVASQAAHANSLSVGGGTLSWSVSGPTTTSCNMGSPTVSIYGYSSFSFTDAGSTVWPFSLSEAYYQWNGSCQSSVPSGSYPASITMNGPAFTIVFWATGPGTGGASYTGKTAPSITAWPSASAITYPQTLTASTLSGGTASVGGTFAWTAPSITPHAGTIPESVTFTPTDTTHYGIVSGPVNVTVNKGTPTVSTWPTASSITYGQTLANSTLSGGSGSVGGSFAWSNPGTAPGAGTAAQSVTFTPTSATDYNTVTGSANVTVNKATSSMSVANSPVTYNGTAQAATVNGSTAGTVSSVKYNGSTTVPTSAGTYTITANFTPTDTTDYTSLTGASAGNFVINKATSSMSVANSPVTYNGTTQAATVNGSTAGTVSSVKYNGSTTVPTSAGTYTITANFTPTDTTDYTSLTGASAGNFVINKATSSMSVANSPLIYNGTARVATVNGSVAGTVSSVKYNGSTTVPTSAGTYAITANFTPTDTTDYTSLTGASAGNFVINQATPTISISDIPASAVAGGNFTVTYSYSGDGSPTESVSSSTTSVCAVAGNTVTYVGAGTCALQASATATTDFTAVTGSAQSFNILGQTVDSGTATLTVNGVVAASASYDQGSTPDSLAAALALGISSQSPVNISESDATLYLQARTAALNTDYVYSLLIQSTAIPLFAQPSFVATPSSGYLTGGSDPSSGGGPVYSYQIPSYSTSAPPSGYDAAGNVVGYSDTANVPGGALISALGFTYDSLNRLTGESGILSGTNAAHCWNYDPFGNRTINYAGPCSDNPAQTDLYYASNQVQSGLVVYDLAGNTTVNTAAGSTNYYLYDAEGRVCALRSQAPDGVWLMMGYAYNGDGERVAKGSISVWSCDPFTNGFHSNEDYILGFGGEQLAEMGDDGRGNMVPQRVYISAGGQQIATYDPDGTHFRLTNWLGSLRVTTNFAGVIESTCTSMPFGDGLSCSGPADPHRFTGKERDTESGNDYFGARYYASTMGRFLSPDWSAKIVPVPYAKLGNPQSLNLYAYVLNNPLSNVDPDGHLGCGFLWLGNCPPPAPPPPLGTTRQIAFNNDKKNTKTAGYNKSPDFTKTGKMNPTFKNGTRSSKCRSKGGRCPHSE